MPARRINLDTLSPRPRETNIGLWADRFLTEQRTGDEPPTSFNTLLSECCSIGESSLYAKYFARWKAALDGLGARTREATTTYRMVAGHGRESVIETGIILHRTYGVPIIPGSSLKGMAASYAHQRLDGWTRGQGVHEDLFGTTTLSGYVTIFDALPLPGKWQLQRDVLTVHHRDYYMGNKPPADWDDPNPVGFLSVTGRFLIALRVPDPDYSNWCDKAMEILKRALAEEGVGGKTSSGYGRMALGGS
jgi:CRISPR-associated protein Cmr6